MKLESLSDVYLIISVLVPGFIYNGVRLNFVPLRQNKETELIILRLLTATAVNYAVSSPLIYRQVAGYISSKPIRLDKRAAGCSFCSPCRSCSASFTPSSCSMMESTGCTSGCGCVRSVPSRPAGTGFSAGRTQPCFVLVTLTDGSEIGAYFGESSMASSDPDRRDIFLEKVYTIPGEGERDTWQLLPGSLGIHIDGAQIAHIEFRRPA